MWLVNSTGSCQQGKLFQRSHLQIDIDIEVAASSDISGIQSQVNLNCIKTNLEINLGDFEAKKKFQIKFRLVFFL